MYRTLLTMQAVYQNDLYTHVFFFSRAEMFNNHNIHLTSNGYLPLIRLVSARDHLRELKKTL